MIIKEKCDICLTGDAVAMDSWLINVGHDKDLKVYCLKCATKKPNKMKNDDALFGQKLPPKEVRSFTITVPRKEFEKELGHPDVIAINRIASKIIDKDRAPIKESSVLLPAKQI